MIKRSSPPARRARKQWTALHFLGAIFVFAAVAVLLAVLFAPEKPPPPPTSKTSYEPKPERGADEEPPVPAPRRRGQREEEPVRLATNDEPVIEEGEGCIVTGMVRDSKTKKPIESASVQASIFWQDKNEIINNEGYAHQKSTQTTPVGKFALRLPTPARYRISAWSHNHIRKDVGKEITLDEDDKTFQIDFELSPGASISGRITENGTGKPVAGMEVYAHGERQHYGGSKESGEDGRYVISGLIPGEYKVVADLHRNRLNLDFGDLGDLLGSSRAVSSVERQVMVKRDDEEVRGVDFGVEPFGTVWGYIMTYEDEPVSGADVILCQSTTLIKQVLDMAMKQRAPITTGADNSGYYEMVGVPLNKEWRLFTFPHDHAPQLSDAFLLTPSQRVARIDIYVLPGSDVYGVVVDPDRVPLPGAEVFCMPATSALLGPLTFSQTFEGARAEQDGTFKLNNIPAGDYQIFGTKRGYKYTTTGEPFHSDGRNDVVGMTVVLTPVEKGTLTVYGTVTDSSGAPLPGVKVGLGGMGAETIEDVDEKETRTDSEGKYAFYDINTGFYLLMAGGGGYETKIVTNVRFDEPTDIVLEAATTISGHVRVRETGQPPEYFSVRALGGAAGASPLAMIEGLGGQSFSTPDGAFTITVKPGDYTLEARATGYAPGRTEVSVSQGQSLTGIMIEMSQSGGSISGRVVTADGQGAGGAVVALNEAGDMPMQLLNMGLQGSVQVGPDGEFAFQRLAAGTYSITARMEGYAPAMHGPVTLGEGQASSGNVIRLTRGNALRGYVAFSGRLEPGAMVTVVGNGITEIATADAGGQYEFNNLPAGSYVGSAVSLNNLTTGSFAPLHGRIEIIDGQNNVYNFGEPTNTALEGLCTPPPPVGTLGFALLLFPGAPADIVALNLTNPASWFQDSSEMAAYVAGMAQIERDGYFRIDNLIQGEFRLDIIYTSLGEIMSGSVSLVHSGPVTVEQGRLNGLDLEVGTQ